jgi:hypothetical protein
MSEYFCLYCNHKCTPNKIDGLQVWCQECQKFYKKFKEVKSK